MPSDKEVAEGNPRSGRGLKYLTTLKLVMIKPSFPYRRDAMFCVSFFCPMPSALYLLFYVVKHVFVFL